MEGVVFTMYDARTNLSLEVVENVKKSLKQNVYKTIIPRNIRLAEAPSHGIPINLCDSKSVGAESYRLLAQEVICNDEGLEFDINSFSANDKSDSNNKSGKKGKTDKAGKTRFILRDAPSTTGTFYQDQILQDQDRINMDDGAIITIGATTLIFSIN